MIIDILTIFPEMFPPVLGASILGRALERGLIEVTVQNLRDYTSDKRRTVDDRPFGGGPGMVMKPEPIVKALRAIERRRHGARPPHRRRDCDIILMAAHGESLRQPLVHALAARAHLVLICGHYEGVDERVRSAVTRELSIGDYILTGGEIPAMVLVDGVARLIPGVLGHAEATREESFADGLLEYPHYTRPVVFRGMRVPQVLRSGNHEAIARWRKRQALARTFTNRPDLIQELRRPRPPSRQARPH